MGYIANSKGNITVKKDADRQKIIDIMKEFANKTCLVDWYDFHFPLVEFGGGDKYYEELAIVFLNALAPFIENGEMRYCGEDGDLWRFIFKGNRWWYQNGHPIYHRGYEITENDVSATKNQIADWLTDLNCEV